MTAAWDGCSDFYEEDEPLDVLLAIADKGPHAVTGRPPSVVDVAESLLERLGGEVDGWKLEKLCYLVQAKHLALTGLPAFLEPIEAWTHGPVVDRLYQEHKHQQSIRTVHGDARIAEKDDTISFVIDAVVREYGNWTGRQLRELTHNQQPWLEARRGLAPTERSRRRISPGTMREHFELQEQLPDDDLEDDCLSQ
ncbi:Panacea domain-containing protein [Mycobacterium canetti]|uniref:Panacea domain-containing protein n=1 Tax=Mycobacterium canetti TaxID=78331 RepID=UPI0002A574F5|nr:type II toxin-antitoxin system antitoxin SocA domain-containing protein [Mycobacterium canetti]CCK63858.1 Protein of unknown function, possible prophage protein [Mycobacterium canettii CIPT 140070017]